MAIPNATSTTIQRLALEAPSSVALAATLAREFDWLSAVLNARLQLYFGLESGVASIEDLPAPELPADATDGYSQLVQRQQLGRAERLVLAVALAPHFRPQALDPFFARNSLYDRRFTECGGRQGSNHAGFLPTGETVLFLLAGNDLAQRLPYQLHLFSDSVLTTAGLIELGTPDAAEPALSGALTITPETLALLTAAHGARGPASFASLARPVTTPLAWNELILEPHALEQLREIQLWLTQQGSLAQDAHLSRYLKPGYRALFYGPPGTGKTLAASLLAQSTGTAVYRVDLAAVASKYLGETEKNLGRIFDMAERQRWILLFDEAEALFGKRTTIGSAHDRYANQEISYLLQRMEQFPGLIIVAATAKANLDEGFIRRFNTVLPFPLPGPAEREKLWRQAFAGIPVAPDVDFSVLAQQHPLTGGAISNVLRRCALAVRQHGQPVSTPDVVQAIQRQVAASD